jgi:hypothetical protein
MDYVRSFRHVLQRIVEFKSYVHPFVAQMKLEEEHASAIKKAEEEKKSSETAIPPAAATRVLALRAADPNFQVRFSVVNPNLGVPTDEKGKLLSNPSLFTSPVHLSHLKGCIRQGKKMGVNFPELLLLKRKFDQAREAFKGALQADRYDLPHGQRASTLMQIPSQPYAGRTAAAVQPLGATAAFISPAVVTPVPATLPTAALAVLTKATVSVSPPAAAAPPAPGVGEAPQQLEEKEELHNGRKMIVVED